MSLYTEDELGKLDKALKVITADLHMFMKIMLYIDKFTKLSYSPERFEELKAFCRVIIDHVPFMISTIERTYITRARRNTKALFSQKKELSYNENLDKIRPGRFNLGKESVFYGCLPTYHETGEKINYRNQCPMFEVCKEIITHEGLMFPVFFTLGFWRVSKPLSVLNLCHDEEHLLANAMIKTPVKRFSDSIAESCSGEVFRFVQSVWQYFSKLSSQWDETDAPNYYYVLTAFYAAFQESHIENTGEACDGLIYPSAMTQAKGLNIVVKPAAVDIKLELTDVQMYTLKSRSLPYDYQPLVKEVKVLNEVFTFPEDFTGEYNLFTCNCPE